MIRELIDGRTERPALIGPPAISIVAILASQA
jgi:hypothetical protein